MNITINLQSSRYEILVDSIKHLPRYIDNNCKLLLVVDSGVPDSIVEKVASIVPITKVYKVPAGESSKSIEEFTRMQHFLLKNGFDRTDYIIALGGGVVIDLAGFVASTYLRGIKYINIPTTTLSQIDSSIGGKVAINFEGIKNTIGAFYHPHAVIIDTDLSENLPIRQFNNGLVEAIKAGIIGDEKLFNLLYNSITKNTVKENIEKIISRSLLVKKRFVERDEKEKNLRKTLNFGHTIGHALESYFGLEQILHGEAVGIGMLMVSKDKPYYNKLLTMIKALDIETELEYDIDVIMALIEKDKKVANNTLTEIFADRVGEGRLSEITFNQLRIYL